MDKYQRENWAKIYKHLEKVGATDNDYYIRAKAITEGKKDPINVFEPVMNPQESPRCHTRSRRNPSDSEGTEQGTQCRS
jgi:hypothetical protein